MKETVQADLQVLAMVGLSGSDAPDAQMDGFYKGTHVKSVELAQQFRCGSSLWQS
jgi:hypothetical protein